MDQALPEQSHWYLKTNQGIIKFKYDRAYKVYSVTMGDIGAEAYHQLKAFIETTWLDHKQVVKEPKDQTVKSTVKEVSQSPKDYEALGTLGPIEVSEARKFLSEATENKYPHDLQVYLSSLGYTRRSLDVLEQVFHQEFYDLGQKIHKMRTPACSRDKEYGISGHGIDGTHDAKRARQSPQEPTKTQAPKAPVPSEAQHWKTVQARKAEQEATNKELKPPSVAGMTADEAARAMEKWREWMKKEGHGRGGGYLTQYLPARVSRSL